MTDLVAVSEKVLVRVPPVAHLVLETDDEMKTVIVGEAVTVAR